SRTAARLEIHLPAKSGGARGSACGDELVQVAAASLGERFDSDLQEAAAADPAREYSAWRQGRGVLPPDGELQLPADVRAVDAARTVDGDPLQHGLVRNAAHRRAAFLRVHGVSRD